MLRALLPAVLALVLPSAGAAQVPGVFLPFGTGCVGSGSGGLGCVNANWTLTPAGNQVGAKTDYALLANTGGAARILYDVELYCRTMSAAPVTMNVTIYGRSTTPPYGPQTTKAQGRMVVGTTLRAWRAKLLPPAFLPAATDFFVVFDNTVGNLDLPIAKAGANVTHYTGSGSIWSGPTTTLPWSFNLLCSGQAVAPILTNTGLPAVNQGFSLDMMAGRPGGVGALLVGASPSSWGPIPLPWDLSPFGAPGCSLLTSIDWLYGVYIDYAGMASVPLVVPNQRALIGAVFHAQWTVLDPVNQLGIVFSNGGTGKIGG
ncbi:MAG: hypothetical protein R3F30_15620 [Planctomycetota bacterium]